MTSGNSVSSRVESRRESEERECWRRKVPTCHLKKSDFYSVGLGLTGDPWVCDQFQQIHKLHKTI